MWIQRIHAEMFQHGVALPTDEIHSEEVRTRLGSHETQLSPAARQRIEVGYRVIDAIERTSARHLCFRGAGVPHRVSDVPRLLRADRERL
jgi:hypothetical protein